MQLGMIGLGRMGANMGRRLQKNGHQCVVYDRSADSVKQLATEGSTGSSSLDDFVKKLSKPRAVWLMVPAGIEYALMAAYAEGLNILKHANVGKQHHETDAETTPLRNPEHYQFDFNLADVTEVWRRGSVVASWLLDLTAISLLEQPTLERFSGRVSDSGEGRWTILAGIESGAPAPVLTEALYERFLSRGEGDFAAKILSAMRFQFGGHAEKKA